MFFPILTALMMLVIGFSALRYNRKRLINQVLAAICFSGVLFFAAQITAKFEGLAYTAGTGGNPLIWIRVKFAVVAFISPFLVWLCYFSVSGKFRDGRDLVGKMIPWAILSLLLGAFAFTEGFKPADSTPGNERYGSLSYLYFGPMLLSQLGVCIASIASAHKLRGIRRLEFRFIAIPLGYLTLLAVVAEIWFAVNPVEWLHTATRVISYMVYVAFGISAWSVTSHRVYHAQQVLASILKRAAILAPIAALTTMLIYFQQRAEPNAYSTAAILLVALVLFAWIDQWLRSRAKANSDEVLLRTTHALRSVAEKEGDPAEMIRSCEALISEFSKTRTSILVREGDTYSGSEIDIPETWIAFEDISSEGFLSFAASSRFMPKSNDKLRRILEARQFSVLLFPNWSASLASIVVLVGERENAVPFTYPELRSLVSLTNVIDALYTRSRFALQLRQAQQLGAIGTRGVSLAHELRNPMSTLRTFSSLLPERLDDREFLQLFAATVPPETVRIEAITERFLDLARPRKYNLREVDLHDVVRHAVVLSESSADALGAKFVTKLSALRSNATVDTDAITQVLLNLLRNALQALERRGSDGPKVVELRTAEQDDEIVIEVEDSGPGISESVRRRLFQPFASADNPSGIGLGLATCREIISVHAGRITASSGSIGGAVFRIVLPRQRQMSSD